MEREKWKCEWHSSKGGTYNVNCCIIWEYYKILFVVLYFKYKDFKKAVVTFDRSYTDVGMGMRIPEIDDEEQEDALIPEKDENAAV